MKKLLVVLGFIFFSTITVAQKRNDFKGPEYKNYKYWQHKTEPTVVFVSIEKKGLMGPAYKNYKPWQNNGKNTIVKVLNLKSTRSKLMGPAYKNYKPWKKKSIKN